MIGRTLGQYTIERELGRGGMGAVYTAIHGLLGRRAAVKVLLPEFSRNQEIVQRFFNEARAATAIKNPSIVEIYDFGWAEDGSAYIVMELMEGESLAARLKRHGQLPSTAVTIARQVANALGAAHRAGIVHRDLKPDNIFLVPDLEVAGGERVKLLDFGIAKLAAHGAVSQTSTGAIMGTPVYMSPEQCEGARHVDPRSDLYSLGCMLFEMIAGRPPFMSDGVGGLIGMHLHVPPPALRTVAPAAPPALEAIVARLLAKSPPDRFQSADELAMALDALGVEGASGSRRAASIAPERVPAGGPSRDESRPSGVSTTLTSAAAVRDRTGAGASRSRTASIVAFGGAAAVATAVAAVLVLGGNSSPSSAPGGAAAAAVVDAADELMPVRLQIGTSVRDASQVKLTVGGRTATARLATRQGARVHVIVGIQGTTFFVNSARKSITTFLRALAEEDPGSAAVAHVYSLGETAAVVRLGTLAKLHDSDVTSTILERDELVFDLGKGLTDLATRLESSPREGRTVILLLSQPATLPPDTVTPLKDRFTKLGAEIHYFAIGTGSLETPRALAGDRVSSADKLAAIADDARTLGRRIHDETIVELEVPKAAWMQAATAQLDIDGQSREISPGGRDFIVVQ